MPQARGLVRFGSAGAAQSAQSVGQDRPPSCNWNFASGSWLYFQCTGDARAEE